MYADKRNCLPNCVFLIFAEKIDATHDATGAIHRINLVSKHWRPLFDGDACRDGRQDNLPLWMVQVRSQVIFFGVDRTTRGARLMFRDLAMVFDQAPIVLSAAECAAHRHLALPEQGEIARLGAKQGF
jgi:hypothetical protein